MLSLRPGVYSEFTPKIHGVSTPAVTRDFQHVADAARRGSKDMTVVLDGVEGPRLEAIPCAPIFSPEGELFYAGFENGKLVLMAGIRKVHEIPLPGEGWDERNACICPEFAAGGHYCYGELLRDESRIVTDDVEYNFGVLKATGTTTENTQTAGGQFHFALCAMVEQDGRMEVRMIVDGKEGRSYGDIWQNTVRWSAEGVLTWSARHGQKLLRVTQSTERQGS